MITQKIGIIGCGNMGGAILKGALASGVFAPEQAYVYDISPAAMEVAKELGVNLMTSDEVEDLLKLCFSQEDIDWMFENTLYLQNSQEKS